MSFESFSFDPRIAAGIKAVGYSNPTPIQEQAIPVILQGRDVLGVAQTGTGKTAAFILPILQRFTQGSLRQVRALVVAPTRELAEQIHQATVDLGKQTKIRSATVYGGVSKGPQLSALRRGVEIVVACPGRLLDHVQSGTIDLSHVEVLVLDEADRMCDMGFLPDIRRILKHLPTVRQTLFFSATMPSEIRRLADSILTDPATVQIGMIAPAETVSHALFPVPQEQKADLLLTMLREKGADRVLVFTRTKHRAKNLARKLSTGGFRASALQGNMTQPQRQTAIDGFRSGRYKVLVATDIAARGIDVPEISHVINFDMPDTVDAYTHRIGRTGRAHRSGKACTLASFGDGQMIRMIERTLGSPIARERVADFDYGVFLPERQFPQPKPTSPRPGKSYRSRTSGSRSYRPSTRTRTRPQPAGAGSGRS
ncbi:DEAD/DEAH box helicase [Candidatus Bipolaricaulota bacterium]|nr:DEAD/DEAH box helicase [Candidatus Bipolaricaulota bacterium]